MIVWQQHDWKWFSCPSQFSIGFYYNTQKHGLRTFNKVFVFHPERLCLGRHFGQINFRTFGFFSNNLSALSWYCESLIDTFHQFKNYYFNKKLSLYIQIPNFYLELRVEFWPQKISDLASVCPQSVVPTQQIDFCTLCVFLAV